MIQPSLVDLRRAAVAGDEAALGHLASRLVECLSQYFRRYWRIQSLGDREDYVHDTLLLALRSLDHCRASDDGAFMAWVMAIGKRVVLHDLRLRRLEVSLAAVTQTDRRGRSVRGLGGIEQCSPDVPDPSTVELEISVPSSCAIVARCAVRAQAVLPANTQELLYRRLIDQASWNEIAAWAATTPSAAKRRFQRARKTLGRQIMRELEYYSSSRRAQAVRWLAQISSVKRSRRGMP